MVVSMDRWVGKVAIVTGASTGIGAAIAKRLVEDGVKVVGLARKSDYIEKMAASLAGESGKLYAVKTDVTKEEEILEAFKWTTENVGPVSILVANAGVHFMETLLDGSTEHWKTMFDINVLQYCIATREAVRIMKENKIDGHIIYMNSLAGQFVPAAPYVNVYSASKHAVTALTETLRLELNSLNSKIKITSVSPGLVDTPILDEGKKIAPKAFENAPILQSEDIADAVEYVLATPPHVQVHELTVRPVGDTI